MFIHHVYFWLNPDVPADAATRLASDCRSLLSQIPGVVQLWAGPPAMTPRDVVDNSYSIGLAVLMVDRAAHDVYQDHPLHHQFITQHKANWDRIRVFDFEG